LAFRWISTLNENGQYHLFAAFEAPTEHCTRPLVIINATRAIDGKAEFSLIKKNSKIGDGFAKIELVKTQSPSKSRTPDLGQTSGDR
jgi:hypothetical protein